MTSQRGNYSHFVLRRMTKTILGDEADWEGEIDSGTKKKVAKSGQEG